MPWNGFIQWTDMGSWQPGQVSPVSNHAVAGCCLLSHHSKCRCMRPSGTSMMQGTTLHSDPSCNSCTAGVVTLPVMFRLMRSTLTGSS